MRLNMSWPNFVVPKRCAHDGLEYCASASIARRVIRREPRPEEAQDDEPDDDDEPDKACRVPHPRPRHTHE